MTGFLGKLPTVGDFITRNLPDAIGNAWMDLADGAFAVGARQDGADWYETCQDAPPLCFALAPGALGGTGWVGLLRPSLDSFGRSYPFTVLSPLPRAVPVLAAPLRLTRWFAKTDIAVLSAMEGSLTVERLGTVLAGIAAAPVEASADTPLVPLQFPGESVQGWIGPVGAGDGADKRAWYEMLLTEVLAEKGAPTLWWQLQAGDAPGRAALLRGMPGSEGFRTFLTGDWSRSMSVATERASA
ncbi:MAG: type VI secretion system-associated protein TagF [Thalassobaculaceae bacterium]|nr:type VI secretion system-associated protein TagF [Thalassobaculaceae bacterium]